MAETAQNHETDRFWQVDWNGEAHADDLMRTMHDGNLVPIVDEEAGGIIAYAIGSGHADMIDAALMAHDARRRTDGEKSGRRLYVVENLTQYDLSESEAETLIRMGFLFKPDDGDSDYADHELGITAFVWEELGLEGSRSFDMFDAILGRRPSDG